MKNDLTLIMKLLEKKSMARAINKKAIKKGDKTTIDVKKYIYKLE